MNKTKVILTILDGFGISEHIEGNAIKNAKTPNISMLMENYPSTTIRADGNYVGLPKGQMGNSEVGHLNMGAGRIVYQELTRINKSIEDGDFFNNETLLNAIKHVKNNSSSLHIMGLVSPGGVHSSMDHMFALLELAKKHNIKQTYLHAFLDGRDTPPTSAAEYLEETEKKLTELDLPKIASVVGRYYAMDRDNRWERISQAYDLLLLNEGEQGTISYEAVNKSYQNGINDEFVKPITILPEGRLNDGDSIIFFNFRPDRARELTKTITLNDFDGFNRKKVLQNINFVSMTQYDETFDIPTAFPPNHLTNILTDVLDRNNIKQFRTAETEKYAHITFFFNGGVEKQADSETRCLVPSPKVATYDLMPEMSAYKVKDKVIEALHNPEYGFILVNFANPDMVGHTGIMNAAIKAIETIDSCVGEIYQEAKNNGFTMLLTADHGNAECMIDPETREPFTAHTTNPVPLILINDNKGFNLQSGGKLADIAPTILNLMDIEKPSEMNGNSLLTKESTLAKR